MGFRFGVFVTFVVSSLVSLQVSAADYTQTCKTFAAPLTGGYCIHRPAHSRNPDVLYHFHGKGGSEQTWAEENFYTGQIRSFWKSRRMQPPTIVSVSFGKIWVLAKKNGSPISGLFETFVDKILPLIEKDLGIKKRGRRLLVGESMGGFNSTQMFFHTRLFRKIAILCAPLSDLSPFASPKEVEEFIQGSKAWTYHETTDPDSMRKAVGEMVQLGQGFYPTEADWKGADPMELATQVRRRMADVYLAAGMHDKYAVYEGNEKFDKLLRAKGVYVEWRPQWGGHCAMDIPSLARFLAM
jgi:pimeloyl-ACP methyl ester carboxylesterase